MEKKRHASSSSAHMFHAKAACTFSVSDTCSMLLIAAIHDSPSQERTWFHVKHATRPLTPEHG